MTDLINKKLSDKNLSNSTQKTYNILLKSIYKKIYNDSNINIDNFFNDYKNIIDYINKNIENKQTKKTIYSALFKLTNIDDYKNVMNEYIKDVNNQYLKQEKNNKSIEYSYILKIYDDLYSKNKDLFKKKSLNIYEYNRLSDIILMMLFIKIEPRRLLDYSIMKIKNYDTNNDNYIYKNHLYFNQYKTSKFYGLQKIEIPKDILSYIKKYIKLTPYNNQEYLFVNLQNKPLSVVMLNQKFNKIFKDKISVNNIRHSYLSEKYKDIPKIKDMINTAHNMGHNINQALLYIQK